MTTRRIAYKVYRVERDDAPLPVATPRHGPWEPPALETPEQRIAYLVRNGISQGLAEWLERTRDQQPTIRHAS